MRRRSRMKALKKLKSYIQRPVILYLMLILCSYVACEPGYLDFDNLPETNFTCAGKVIGGYYADLETSCQMFHVCTIGQLDEPMDIKFLCLNGTVFDQETRVCERVDEVDCTKSEKFYYLNLELYGNTMLPLPEDESLPEIIGQSSQSSSTSTTVSPPTTAAVYTPKTVPTISNVNLTNQKDHRPYSLSHASHSSHESSHSSNDKKPASTIGTTKPTPQYVSSTEKPYDSDELLDDEEYEYDDDYYTTNGKELQDYQNQNTHNTPLPPPLATTTNNQKDVGESVFSPQQFILNQNSAKESTHKPAISFQQQQFQNGGTLTVTNSHVTSKNWHQSNPTPPISSKKSQILPTSSSLSSSTSSISSSTPSPDLSYLQSFRIQGQGFRLPSVHLPNAHEQQHILQQQQHELLQKQLQPHSSPFEGYRKHMPQVTLRLPIDENRPHKEILGFDSLDDDFPTEEHKELKRSDHGRASTTNPPAPTSFGHRSNNTNQSARTITPQQAHNNANQRNVHTQHYQQQQQQQHLQSGHDLNTKYDKVLLTPQDQYIPTLPKVIITASASVTDANGKKLNYSVGNVIASSNIKLPPLTYDEYREDDVSLDPFFLDVPKILPRRGKRNAL